ncbi:hypothetical protein GCM10027277_30250 [Pseudoduganella ginsengisoli]|uniref:Uncharacterized protein n=1 Tax=Pseudoduganella ginsengisoli TaxID=1462440 RepID=A0A6L6PY02_9BURK|nr:hypothetical protein [Pseudoduganella ginsengisoli]MTW02437.1 hypothetical protein [Pseudoduganella ginsengisoli]
MRNWASLAVLLTLAACGNDYQPVQLYQATTPACSKWEEGSTFALPENITVTATPPIALPDGGVEINVVYMVPRGGMAQFTSRAFKISAPKGPPLANGELVTIYRRGTEGRPEIVDVIEQVPVLMTGIGTSDTTQYRFKLHFKGKLPERFDFMLPDMKIKNERYPVRTFTYRYFEDRKTYGMCS